jgi:hypothetical protein
MEGLGGGEAQEVADPKKPYTHMQKAEVYMYIVSTWHTNHFCGQK